MCRKLSFKILSAPHNCCYVARFVGPDRQQSHRRLVQVTVTSLHIMSSSQGARGNAHTRVLYELTKVSKRWRNRHDCFVRHRPDMARYLHAAISTTCSGTLHHQTIHAVFPCALNDLSKIEETAQKLTQSPLFQYRIVTHGILFSQKL